MEVIISALGIVVGALLNIPSRAADLSEQKKGLLARELVQLVEMLGRVGARGERILDLIDALPSSLYVMDAAGRRRELIELIDQQTRELARIGDKVRYDILGDRSALRDSYAIKESIHSGEIEKVLRVYEPGLAPRLSSVVGLKTDLLRGLSGLNPV